MAVQELSPDTLLGRVEFHGDEALTIPHRIQERAVTTAAQLFPVDETVPDFFIAVDGHIAAEVLSVRHRALLRQIREQRVLVFAELWIEAVEVVLEVSRPALFRHDAA